MVLSFSNEKGVLKQRIGLNKTRPLLRPPYGASPKKKLFIVNQNGFNHEKKLLFSTL